MINKFKTIFLLLLYFISFSCTEVKKKDVKESGQTIQAEQNYQKGIACFASKKYYIAMQYFNDALKIDSSFSKALVSRGCTKAELQDFIGAIDDFDKVIFKHPNDTIAYYNRGVVKLN